MQLRCISLSPHGLLIMGERDFNTQKNYLVEGGLIHRQQGFLHSFL
jgi:hypothetical protein